MSLAGPAANLAAAFAAGIIIRYFLYPSEAYLKILVYMILMNTGLGLFNLIPIPPLDGSMFLRTCCLRLWAKNFGAPAAISHYPDYPFNIR